MARANLPQTTEEYPANSRVSKDREIQSVVRKGVRRQRPGIGKRLSETFLGDDAKDVGASILWDILIPSAKDLIYDMVTGGFSMALFGGAERGRSRGGYSRGSGPYVSYGSMSRGSRERRDRDERPTRRGTARGSRTFDDVVFDARGDAEQVIDNLIELIKDYGVASVADFYQFAGLEHEYTDSKYGWADLRDCRVKGDLRHGYTIDFPRTEVID